MKSFRHAYWFASSIFKRYRWIILSSIFLGILVTINASKIINLMPKAKTMYIGRAGSYSLAQLPIDIQTQISDGLTLVDSTGKPEPALAQSWNIQESGKLYQFTLDPSKTWQDGKKVTTQDLQISLSDVEAIIESDHVISFRLKDPFSPFPVVVSQPLFRKVNYKKFLFFNRTKIIGTNEFSIVKVKTSGGIIRELVLKSDVEKKVYRFYPTEEDALTAFKLGKVDVLEDISSFGSLDTWENVNISEVSHFDRYVGIFINTQDETLTNKAIRQALAYSIPKQEYQDLRALGPINPNSWAYNPQVKPYSYNQSSARELLDKVIGESNQKISLTLTTTQAFIDEADMVAESWRQIGIDVNIKIVNFPDTNDYQVLLIGQHIPKDPDQYTYWHSTQGTNFTHYNSPRIDKILEDARKTIDDDERVLLYQDFQRFLVEDSPAIFLRFLNSYYISR